MAMKDSDREGSVAVLERDADDQAPSDATERSREEAPAPEEAEEKREETSDDDEEDLDYEVEFATPFGKIEFEFEPKSSWEKKDRIKRAKAERAAAKKAALAEKKAQYALEHPPKGGSILVPALIIGIVLIGAVVLAWWLFSRPEPEEEAVPEQYLAEGAGAEPEGFVAKVRRRIRDAVRAGRRASLETQEAERLRYEAMAEGREV